ncbi:MAG: outer membrane lipoprotein carrier protein LolA [Bacteroidota bacterium]
MRSSFLIVIFILSAQFGFSQYTGFTPVADLAKFSSAFAEASQKIRSIKSNFVQVKELSMLAEKITSKGKFLFKKESMVRMEYTQPFQYLMILNRDKIFVKDAQKENKVSAKSNKIFQQINQVMIDCMQGTILSNKDFQTRVFENKTAYLVEMVPVVKGLKAMFKHINVTVDKNDYSVNTIEMLELSGDNTTLRFSNKELNTNIEDALFNIK